MMNSNMWLFVKGDHNPYIICYASYYRKNRFIALQCVYSLTPDACNDNFTDHML